MSYKNKTYVAFDGDEDMSFYRTMQMWKENDHIEFDFHDAHELNSARDTSSEESIKAQLRARMANSKQMVLLVGKNTRFLRKFVPWEIELARKKDIPIVIANLNSSKGYEDALCPSAAKDGVYTISVPFRMKAIRYALDDFPSQYYKYRGSAEYDHTYRYLDSVYESLGI